MPKSTTCLAMLLALAAAASAQAQIPSLGSLGGKGGGMDAGGLMGGMLPNVSSMGAGNAAGVLGYCVKQKYLGGGAAAAVLGRLQGKSGVTSSSGYTAGESGLLQLNGGGSSLSLDSLKGSMKTRMCDLVLTHAKSLI